MTAAPAGRTLPLFEPGKQGDRWFMNYFGGQKKKIALVSALLTKATVLLLHEPFTGEQDPSRTC